MAKESHRVVIHTFQHINTLNTLTNKGFISGNHKFSLPKQEDWDFLAPHYNWMRKQMSNRIKNHSGDYPVWAWLEKPSMKEVHKRYGKDQVKIVAEVPLSRCLLSDFELWEGVLNNTFLSYDLQKMEDFFECISPDDEKGPLHYKFVPTEDEMDKGKELIFDVFTISNNKEYNDYMGLSDKGRRIQVCVDRILLSEITNITLCETD